MKIPTPEEFDTVWLPKRMQRENSRSERDAKRSLKWITRQIKRGELCMDTWVTDDHAQEIVEKTMKEAGWDVRWPGTRSVHRKIELSYSKRVE